MAITGAVTFYNSPVTIINSVFSGTNSEDSLNLFRSNFKLSNTTFKDVNSDVDVVNGFIEVYDDPLAYRGAFESVVSVKDHQATKVIAAIAKQAQWFEDNSPLIEAHKKKEVKGITGKAITVVIESGDAS